MFFKRIAFIDFLKGMIMSSRESHANEIRDKILPKMCSYIQFVEAFTPAMSHAAVGAGNLVELEEAAEAEDASGKGLANAVAKEFDAFVDGLTPSGKAFANMLSQTHGAVIDSEFRDIVDVEMKGGAFSFSFPDLV